MGVNHLRMKEYRDARKVFERALEEVPAGTRCDLAFLGLVTVAAEQRKPDEVRRLVAEMRSRFPDSAATRQAMAKLPPGAAPP